MYKKSLFLSLSQLFFVSLYRRRTMIIYVSKHKIFRSHGARDTLLPEHQADVSLAKITRTSCLRPGIGAPYATETSHVSSVGSKHYLPALRAAVTALFSRFSASQTLPSPNSEFPQPKPRLSLAQTSALLSPSQTIFLRPLYCKIILPTS